MYQPLGGRGDRGHGRLAAFLRSTLVPVVAALAPPTTSEAGTHRGRVARPPAQGGVRAAARLVPAPCRARSPGHRARDHRAGAVAGILRGQRLHAASSTRGRSCCRRCCRRRRRSTRSIASTTASRTCCATFPEVEDVVRRTGPRRAHRRPDAAHALGRARRAQAGPRRARCDALGDEHARARRAGAGCLGRCSRRRSACASTRAWAARPPTSRCASSAPISTSWPGWPTRAAADHGRRRRHRPICASSSSPACRSCRITLIGAAVARVGLTPGDVIAAVRIGLVGEAASEVWIGQRRFDCRRASRKTTAAVTRTPSATLLVDGHDGTRIPLGQLADDRRRRSAPARSAAKPAAAGSRWRRRCPGATSAVRRPTCEHATAQRS